ncbi:interleukin-10-like [Scleropages formosus]|uniref:interleukin-10-like n=1 Tax=Scleropages formosus TaxID=113540 RepID=UPI000878332C|nr:interleukin-10-like [Scleropages formosus]
MRALLLTCATLLAAAVGHRTERSGSAARCLQHCIPDEILGQLFLMAHRSRSSLPKDDNKHTKLLPNFSRSLRKPTGIRVIKEMLHFYFYDVFSYESLEISNQEKILTSLSRMKEDVSYCLGLYPSKLSSKDKNLIRIMKATFTKMRTAGVYKAIGEFKTLLIWMDTYMHIKNNRKKQEKQPGAPTSATEVTSLM